MTRNELAARFAGIGAELGVAAGAYSALILANPAVRLLWSIDRWCDHHDEREQLEAMTLLARFGARSRILHSTFAEAARTFHPDSLDFIYIDGYADGGQEHGRTLVDWWPKLRSGGIFAGHDYSPTYPLTVNVVDAFMDDLGVGFELTDEQLPSWWVIKP